MSSSGPKVIRIGGFSAFWGDTSTGAAQLVRQTESIDYIIGDYLAEVTMGILGRGKQQAQARGGMGEGGFVAEFVSDVWKPLMRDIITKKIKVVTNAGGMNPLALKAAIEKAVEGTGLPAPVVAAVIGDDLLPTFDKLVEDGKLKPFEVEGEEDDLSITKRAPVLSVNAYLGAFPIARALSEGAQIVVTGRCVDSALALGPLIHEFGWRADQLDLLAQGSVAGHLIECATQSTGGNFTDWEQSLAGGWDNVGFPIVECNADGSFVLTKPDSTGGLVSKGTVGEQLLYEILDPANYMLPDVNVDFTQITLEELAPRNGTGRVLVKGARGKPAPSSYKASITVVEGWRIDGMLMIGGRDAGKKAEAVGKAIIAKVNRILSQSKIEPIKRYNLELLGTEHCMSPQFRAYGPHKRHSDTREVILRIVARHTDRRALNILAKEVAPAATSMAPGITGGGSGRPQSLPALGYRSCLVAKDIINIQVHVGSTKIDFYEPNVASRPSQSPSYSKEQPVKTPAPHQPLMISAAAPIQVPLITLCVGRSGDKGDVCNIGIMCRRQEHFDLVKEQLTADAVKEYMKHLVFGKVIRYELPGSSAFNFVCTRALGGGGLNSMNMDRQGKCYAQMLLDFPIKVPLTAVSGSPKL